MKRVVSCLSLSILLIAFTTAALGQDEGQAVTPSELGQINGTAWHDLNGDGLREADEPGLSRWRVDLSDGRTTTTDDAGHYQFAGLLPAPYLVSIESRSGWSQIYPDSGTGSDPAYAWTHVWDGSPAGDIECFKVAVAQDGSLYCLGVFTGTVDIDPSTEADLRTGSGRGFLTKVNPDQSHAWTVTFGNLLRGGTFDMILDAFDEVLLAYDQHLEKRDRNGTLLWQNSLDQLAPGITHIRNVCVDDSDNIFCAGDFSGTVEFHAGSMGEVLSTGPGEITALFIMRINADGSYGWTRKTSGHPVQAGALVVPYAICPDASGHLYVAGAFRSQLDFDPGPGRDLHASAGDWDIFLTKLGRNGDYHWTHSAGGPEYDLAYDVCVDSHDAVYLAGTYSLSVQFGTLPQHRLTTPHIKIGAGFVAKYLPDRSLTWIKDLGEAERYTALTSLVITDEGRLFAAGERMPLTALAESTSDLFMLELDSQTAETTWRTGQSELVKTSGTWIEDEADFAHYPRHWGLDLSDAGDVFVSGRFDTPTAFGPPTEDEYPAPGGRENGFVSKYEVERPVREHSVNLQAGQVFYGLDFGERRLMETGDGVIEAGGH